MKGWRTILFNAAALLPILADLGFLALQVLTEAPELKALLPAGWLPYYTAAVAVANIYLRTLTTTPVGKRDA